MRNTKLLIAALLFQLHNANAQTLNGMATGNYAGIAGLNFNPASIVDSRYKFDLNLAGGQFFFNNNFLYAKPGVFVRRLFQKDPYNNSFSAVKQDLLQPIAPAPAGRVFARQNTEFQLPLSFMLTTGKRSAIAVNLRNRYSLSVDSLNPQTAQLFYDELRNPSLYNTPMDNSGLRLNFLNWQEIGFTYGRVIFNANKHFLKAAVTAKWIGGNAGAFIKADALSVSFADSQTLSMASPRIQYGRTARADFDRFTRRELFTSLEGQRAGFDVGLVYEFRGRIGNFRYTDEDYQSRLRRDKNKYTLRLGVALNDIGRMELGRLPLTRDHSAAINNWDFSGVKANNLGDWDTAYAKQVNYFSPSDSTFVMKLPTALVANIDLHLFKGFYINGAMQRRVTNLGEKGNAQLFAGEWYAVTPRFEGRWLGIYVPFVIQNKTTTIGASLRFGPIYLGSNNLLFLVQNKKVPMADVHAGIRLPIGFGKPSKILKGVEKATGVSLSDEFEDQLDSNTNKVARLEARIALLEKMADTGFRTPTVIVNNYITDSLGKSQISSQVSSAPQSSTKSSAVATSQPTEEPETDEETRKEAEKYLKKEGVSKPKEPKMTKNEKKNAKRQRAYEKETQQYNDAMVKEMKRMRKQQAITSTALVGAVTAGTIVDANQNKAKKDTVATTTVPKNDTVYIEKVRVDTVLVRDTVKPDSPATFERNMPATNVLPSAHIYFNSGSTKVDKKYAELLDKAADWMRMNPTIRVKLTGVTDATGSMQANTNVAKQRVQAIINEMKTRGIDIRRFDTALEISTQRAAQGSEENRRVDMQAIRY